MQEVASKLISSTVHTDDLGNPINPLDANFRSLGLTSMTPIKRDCQEFQVLQAYAHDTHGSTHRHFQVNIVNAYRVERYGSLYIHNVPLFTIFFSAGEKAAWNERGFESLGDGDRLLLWHGSRTTNFAGLCMLLDGRLNILTWALRYIEARFTHRTA